MKKKIRSLSVKAIGLGAMSFSHVYAGIPRREHSVRVLQECLDGGYDFFDTAALYGARKNETLIAQALGNRRKEYILATKCGLYSIDEQNVIDGSPQSILDSCEESLRGLKTDYIDLLYLHRVDPQVPVEESVGAMSRLVEQGKIREIGLSEVAADTLKRAHAIHPIAAVQSEYSLCMRLPEQKVLQTCDEIGAAFVAFSPVSRGYLTGKLSRDYARLLPKTDFRKNLPRFSDENYPKNLQQLVPLEAYAKEKQCSLAQLVLAWLIQKQENVIAIPGTRFIDHALENLAALDLVLTLEEIATIESLFQEKNIIGSRYNHKQMTSTDSERDRTKYPQKKIKITIDDLSSQEIAHFLEEHLKEMKTVSPPESKHALDLEELKKPKITFWSVRENNVIIACGALKELSPSHGEIKSMRVATQCRGKGVASILLCHILKIAKKRDYTLISLETGSMAFFYAAHKLYQKHGFKPDKPFGDYREDPNSVFMSKNLTKI